jgi:multidrug efflux pump subunit AcrA (membrane-fusion protein)
LEYTRLYAPFSGYVQKRLFDSHETVAAGMPVISMIDTRYFEVEIDVPSSDYVRRHLFNRFTAVADVFPDRVFPLELIEKG